MKTLWHAPLWQKILLGMVLGLIVGLIFGEEVAFLKVFGDIFIRLIKMLVVPLVFFSLISGVASLGDPSALGRMGAKSIGIYVSTSIIAIAIGIVFAEWFAPGAGVVLELGDPIANTPEARSLVDTLVQMIPTNPLAAMVEGNMLQIIVVALLFGLAVSLSPGKGDAFGSFSHSAAEVCFTLTMIVMKVAPIGVFGLLAWVAGTQDPEVLVSLAKIVVVFLVACTVHCVAVFGGTLFFIMRLSPLKFIAHIKEALIMAFSTSSSSATLPVTMRAVDKLGVSETTASFTLPLGATINMNGSALYQGICAVFVAQAMGVDLSMAEYVTITATTVLAAIGTAGIPGAGLLMLTLVLSSVGLPAEAIGIILGIDRIMDMVRTSVNVAGDAFAALVIDASEKRFDKGKFLNA